MTNETQFRTLGFSKVAKGLEHIVVPANEQSLDRLSAEVLEIR